MDVPKRNAHGDCFILNYRLKIRLKYVTKQNNLFINKTIFYFNLTIFWFTIIYVGGVDLSYLILRFEGYFLNKNFNHSVTNNKPWLSSNHEKGISAWSTLFYVYIFSAIQARPFD